MAAQKKKKKGKKKEKTKKETNIIKIHISIKGQHKVKGESSSIREAEETGIWTMYLTPHRHALGTTMNKRQESRKKNKPERGRPTELHRAIHPNREREQEHSLCAALKCGGGQGGLGNDATFAHANNGHRGKSKRTWRTPGKHPTARDRVNLRLGFPQKRPNTSEKQLSGGAEPQPPVPLLVETQGGSWSCRLGRGRVEFLGGEGQNFSPFTWGWPSVAGNPSS